MFKDDQLDVKAIKNKMNSLTAMHMAEKAVLMNKIETKDIIIEVLTFSVIALSCVIGIMIVILSKGV